jgi:hypothetical protein
VYETECGERVFILFKIRREANGMIAIVGTEDLVAHESIVVA